MADYNVGHYATLGNIKTLANRTKSEIAKAIAALPTEQFLDQAKTQFVALFNWSSEKYPNSTNPNLEGQPVLVLALKGINNSTGAETITYRFLDMSTLVDHYSAKSGDSAKVLNISGYEIEVKIDPDSNNILTVTNNGLMVEAPDVSEKADIVTGATENNFASLDSTGNIRDSRVSSDDFWARSDSTPGHLLMVGSRQEVTAVINNKPRTLGYKNFASDSGILAEDLVTKVTNPTTGNFAGLDANGKLTDSGKKPGDFLLVSNIATDAEMTAILTEVFGA